MRFTLRCFAAGLVAVAGMTVMLSTSSPASAGASTGTWRNCRPYCGGQANRYEYRSRNWDRRQRQGYGYQRGRRDGYVGNPDGRVTGRHHRYRYEWR